MTRQESFEAHWAEVHDLPAETMAQYRWKDQDGYRLPQIATAYRNYCAGWDALETKNEREREEFLDCLADYEHEDRL